MERAQLAIGLSPINDVHVCLGSALLKVSINAIVCNLKAAAAVSGKLLEFEAVHVDKGIRMEPLARESVGLLRFCSEDLKYIMLSV